MIYKQNMKTYFLLLTACFFVFSTVAQTTPTPMNNEKWNRVDEYEKQSLPQSALETVNQIMQDAIKEGNMPELIKCLIFQLKYETAINQDLLPDKIAELEQWIQPDKNAVDNAMLYSIIAELYANYYNSNSYRISQRTDVTGYAPDDIREWSANLFVSKIADYVRLSLLPVGELQKTDVLDYRAIVEEGQSSRNLRPTLYDFLTHRGIELLKQHDLVPQIVEMYRNLVDFRLKENNPKALVIADLERLEFIYRNTQSENAETMYLEALQQLENQYVNDDFCVEILFKKATFFKERQPNRNAYVLYGREGSTDDNESVKEDIRQACTICIEGMRKYPHYERIGILRNLLESLTASHLTSNADNAVYPDKHLSINLRYRNINKLIIQIHKLNFVRWAQAEQYKNNGQLIQTTEIDLTNDFPYLFNDTLVQIPVREPGHYEYVIYANSISTDESPINKQFSVSRLASMARGVEGQHEFLVTDRISGKPVEGATISFYRQRNNTLELIDGKTATTNKLGLAITTADNNLYYKASYGNDTALVVSPTPWVYTQTPQDSPYTNMQLFTDRSIYRPGQTVYFKGIAYETIQTETRAIPNKTYTITLRDANYQEVANKTVTTNSFGSFSGEFQLPQGLLTGFFSLRSDMDNAHAPFRVEEYKRPTFDIYFPENEKIFRLDEKVTVEGNVKSFSGVSVANTDVRYRVTRQAHWMFRWMWSNPVQVAEGVIQTGDDGNFEITFTAERAFEDRNRKTVSYTYIIEASVTDANGETQQAQTNVNIGDISGYLDIQNLREVVDKETAEGFTIRALNLNGNPVQTSGTYDLFSLKPKNPTKLDAPAEDWIPDKKVAVGVFEADKVISLAFKSLASGRYRIIANATDVIEKQTDFTLASTRDKRPPVPVYEWVMTPKTTCVAGESVEIFYGSSAKNVYVLYEIFQQNGKRAAISRFTISNQIRTLTIPFLEAYGEGITVVFTFIRDSRVFTKQVAISKTQPDKNLALKMEVFRDRLLPGQQEEWKISVKDAAHHPVLAELLAVMYDASLDKIQHHAWRFNPVPRISLTAPYPYFGKEFDRTYSTFTGRMKNYPAIPEFTFDRLNWFGWNMYHRALFAQGEGVLMRSRMVSEDAADMNVVQEVYESAAAPPIPSAVAFAAPSPEMARQDIGGGGDYDMDEKSTFAQPEIQIRRNFNETAFFYPQLKTNEDGETVISFTVPESNTTWKLMGLAHTEDLKFGQIVERIISQKQLMIRPNIPRFLREGDRVTISTNISNLSEKDINGTVQIECFNPATEQPNILISENSQNFRLEAGKTTTVSWSFQVPSGIDLTALKIVAHSPEFSDGEQHLIPVLPNRMLVTESLPLTIQGGQTRTFMFNAMKSDSPTKENYRLTVEFTSNPIWYAVQALPAMTTPESDNVLSWFAAYYSNTLAAHLANSTPKIRSIIDIWTKQGGTKETLLSQLEKNQELKAVLLEETPWVLEAQNETGQRQRLSLLFDINRNNYLNAQALEKLRSLQTEEGGWTWFKGMPASVSITQWILYGMGELSLLNVENYSGETRQMQMQAIRFIDQSFKRHYENYRKNNPDKKPETLSTYELEYLFVRSMYQDIPLNETGEAFKFYLEATGERWGRITRLYDRAIAAMVLQRNGNTQAALSIIRSLREHATRKPDEGMFWANNRTQAFLFQSATCVHTFMMQAFHETGSSPQEMDAMKLWLLQQKRTQQWESIPATVNAVNILLQTGTNWLESEGKVSIQIGNRKIGETGENGKMGEVGTGYIRTVFDVHSITSDMSRITVSKAGAGPGWGAVYGQYFEDLDKITAAKTGLNVEKSLFVEKITPTGKTLIPVTETQSLKVGDKVIVRLVVRTDRDLEYVLLKDLRASCFEPAESLSGIRWAQQAIYYQSIRDASMNFYFYNLPRGTYVFEYPLYVNASGDYSNGIATIQCLYAPEFVSHTSGGRVKVE